MPILKRRYDHVKIYRPAGTAYAVGHDTGPHAQVMTAVENALVAFENEFGRQPDRERTTIEVAGDSFRWAATVLELPEKDA